jgi:hypothetical protein
VTESQHLVDIINQTDLVEDVDSEQKLGQPMINMAWIEDWGTIDLYILPVFRERTLPGEKARFSFGLPISDATYESQEKDKHVDWAGRYTQSFDNLDLGLSWFVGTSREPILIPVTSIGSILTPPRPLSLSPFYSQIAQVGFEVQYFYEDLLFKLEVINRNQSGKSYRAHTSGMEYTFNGIGGSAVDLGIIAEYSFDERRQNAPTILENDLFLSLRLTGNDSQSTELLAGGILDVRTNSIVHSIEAKRRLGEDFIIKLVSRGFDSDDPKDHLYPIRKEGYTQLELVYYL